MFFISVASKGVRVRVSGLESTLAGCFVSVAFKWVRKSRGGPVHKGEDGDVKSPLQESGTLTTRGRVKQIPRVARDDRFWDVRIECGRRAANRAKRGHG